MPRAGAGDAGGGPLGLALAIALTPRAGGTEVGWRQVFDTPAEFERVAAVVRVANEQNLERLAAEVARG